MYVKKILEKSTENISYKVKLNKKEFSGIIMILFKK